MFRSPLRKLFLISFLFVIVLARSLPAMTVASFADIHRRAENGEVLHVVFFGGSLTWGANASNPSETSFRGLMSQFLVAKYPKARFAFHDAAIGGTGSVLGMFRLERDVLRHKPDLVFLDFTMNDVAGDADVQTLAAYEYLLRTILKSGALVQPVITTFKFFVDPKVPPALPRVEDHLRLARAYGVPPADIHRALRDAVHSGKVKSDVLWPFDGVHPDDPGYEWFFRVVRDQFEENIANQIVARVPDKPVVAERYPKVSRQILVEGSLPEGWRRAKAHRTSLWFDGLASRWMGDVASARVEEGKQPAPLEIAFTGSIVGLFGERDSISAPFRVWIDGKAVSDPKVKKGDDPTLWRTDSSRFSPARAGTGNLFSWIVLSRDLSDGEHRLRIEPVFEGSDPKAELRIESVCSAGR